MQSASKEEVYSTQRPHTTAVSERPSTALDRRRIDALKAGVRIEQIAGEYGEFKLLGNGRLLGRCVSPAHEDKTASLTIFTEDQGFKCFGCGAHGDVLDLVQLAEGCKLWQAMALLSTRYGLELPGRPRSWYAKAERQDPVRNGIDEMRIRRLQNFLYKMVEPFITDLEDAERTWNECWTLAGSWYERMRGAGNA